MICEDKKTPPILGGVLSNDLEFLLEDWAQVPLQHGSCSEQPALDRSFWFVQLIGDLADVEMVEVSHHDDLSVSPWQSLDGFHHLTTDESTFGFLGRCSSIGERVFHVFNGLSIVSSLSSQVHNAVQADAGQPWSKRSCGIEILQASIRLDERLLDNIIGVLGVVQLAQSEARKHWSVSIHEEIKCDPITLSNLLDKVGLPALTICIHFRILRVSLE